MASEQSLFVVDESFADDLREAMVKAGRLLSVRARTEHEVRRRLAEAGFGDAVVEQTITRLLELGLVDDLEFARAWIQERSARKSLGPRALQAELSAKGVPRDVVDEALAGEELDEDALAADAAARWVRKVARFPLAEQAHKLEQMLLRKGFSRDAAASGARAALPPEGWD